jgi:hypothetical protein
MKAIGAVIGGEGNGGVIDPRVVFVRDSFVAMALVLERMCAGDTLTTIDSLARALPQLVMKKTKVDLSPEIRGPALAEALARIEKAFPEARPDRLDGLRLDWPGGWLLVRASNTEPIVRLVAEDRDAARVDEALARYTQGEPVTEYLLSEIFVAIDNPDQEDDVRRTVDDLVKQLVSGAIPFAVAAQQFSQAASAADGGDIGWVQRGQFDPETEGILATTDVGRMTQAIRTPSGFYLYGMREKRVLAPASPDDARVDIAQIVLPVPAGATPADRDSVMALAETIRETVQGCADLERVASEMRVPAPVRVPDVRIGDLAASTRDRIRPLKVGETCTCVTDATGTLLCSG